MAVTASVGRYNWMRVVDVMTTDPLTVTPTETIGQADELMNTNRIRQLPVVEGKELVGIVTERISRSVTMPTNSLPSTTGSWRILFVFMSSSAWPIVSVGVTVKGSVVMTSTTLIQLYLPTLAVTAMAFYLLSCLRCRRLETFPSVTSNSEVYANEPYKNFVANLHLERR